MKKMKKTKARKPGKARKVKKKAKKISETPPFSTIAAIMPILAFLILALAVIDLTGAKPDNRSISGMAIAAAEQHDEQQGCCEQICKQTLKASCQGEFALGKKCSELQQCNVGCCIDKEGYCLNNYLQGNCERKEGMFVAADCTQTSRCISSRPNSSLVGFTGYPNVFSEMQQGIAFSEPVSAQKGERVLIKALLFENASNVKAKIREESYSKEIALFDDGRHDDGNPKDGLFAGTWDSSEFPSFAGTKKISFTIDINETESTLPDYFLLTTGKCKPVRKPWSSTDLRKNIIFIASANKTQAKPIEMQALSVLGQIASSTALMTARDDDNFYLITEPVQGATDAARQKTKQECSFYDSAKDTVIFLDNNYDDCEQNNGFIRTTPQIILNTTALENATSMENILTEFCKIVITQKQIQEKMLQSLYAPNITLLLPLNNSIYTTREIPVSFIVTDIADSTLPYEIYADINEPSMLLGKGIARNGGRTAAKVNISDGNHTIWVESENSAGNLGHSDVYRVYVNVSNFVITVASLNLLSYLTSPDINFTITHATDAQLNYSILDVNKTLLNGTAAAGQLNNFKTNLNKGEHTIQILSRDSSNATTRSLPYWIWVG